MSLIPKRVFRSHDGDQNVGMFFVLANKHGPDGKLIWRPDSEAIPVAEAHVADFEQWENEPLAKAITRFNEIPVSEGTESITVTQVSMSAAPRMMPGTRK